LKLVRLGVEMKTPPQLTLLYIISRLGRAHQHEIASIVEKLQRSGIDLGYKFVKLVELRVSKELFMDLNLLKVLGLVREDGGELVITEKGKVLIEKIVARGVLNRKVLKVIDELVERRIVSRSL